MAEIILETKLVGAINGAFHVASYQRGYRWGPEEVKRLLDDVYTNGNQDYCLQPIVVKNNGDSYELIDGQQRLTTLYLIYKYMHNASGGFLDEPQLSITYETREKSQEFLTDIDMARKDENIDFWFICNAYETISEWFATKEKKSTLTNINKYFDEKVKVIWYEVDESQDAIALFTRLNIGKIPLTSAELVKAMFLCRGRDTSGADMAQSLQSRLEREKQEEISLLWDNIEKELHDDSLWYFLTNRTSESYQTRIDLVLDMMANTPADNKEKYFTYFAFDQMQKTTPLDVLWRKIQNTFLLLKDWYENHTLYHKIGYLIASNTATLNEIFQYSQDKTKRQFADDLDARIRASIRLKGNSNYGELSYEKKTDYDNISRLLLLFNVESVRQNGACTQWFPFDKFKYEKGRKVAWSLEHIHAQQSEGMRTQDAWKKWLELHTSSIEALNGDHVGLLSEMAAAIQKERLERNEFESLQQKVVELLSVDGNNVFLHSISNLALLNTSDNAALNNSTFDVKRNAIIEMDKAGQYIPFCTKMVFLKYYTPSADNQLHFWGAKDREAYVAAMNTVLKDYLTDAIVIEEVE